MFNTKLSGQLPFPGSMLAHELVAQYGGRYAEALGIDLLSGKSAEIYKWFLAAILFGARISEVIATKTYREFVLAGAITPQDVVNCGWNGLVEILDRGGYVRYDFKTATKLLQVNQTLLTRYGGDLNLLYDQANNLVNLEQIIKELGKGIGEITVNIFLREMRGVWPLAEVQPAAIVIEAAKALGYVPENTQNEALVLAMLKTKWQDEGMALKHFADFEAALVRYGKKMRKEARTKKREVNS